MSIRHVADVLDLTLAPNLKLVALVYANSANDEDDVVFLSIRRVAERSGYSPRRAQEITRQLETAHLLNPVGVDALPPTALERLAGIPANRWPTVYRLDVGAQSSHPCSRPGAQSSTRRGATSRRSGMRAAAPEPEVEPETNQAPEWARALRYRPPRPDARPTDTAHVWAIPDGDGPGRRVDLIWETLVEVCGLDTTQIPDDARGSLNRSIRQLRKAGADPVEVRRRANRYRSGSAPGVPQGAKLTHRALVTHWPELGTPDVGPVAQAARPAHEHRWEDHHARPDLEVCTAPGCPIGQRQKEPV